MTQFFWGELVFLKKNPFFDPPHGGSSTKHVNVDGGMDTDTDTGIGTVTDTGMGKGTGAMLVATTMTI